MNLLLNRKAVETTFVVQSFLFFLGSKTASLSDTFLWDYFSSLALQKYMCVAAELMFL